MEKDLDGGRCRGAAVGAGPDRGLTEDNAEVDLNDSVDISFPSVGSGFASKYNKY